MVPSHTFYSVSKGLFLITKLSNSGFLDKLAPGNLIMADRGFTIRYILMNKKVDLNIPPFLNGWAHFTATEEINTRRIARVRIHVE